MTRAEAQRPCQLTAVSNDEWQCAAWNSGGRSLRVRLRFAADALDRIELWWFETPHPNGVTEQALDALSRLDAVYRLDATLVRHLRGEIKAVPPESLRKQSRGFSLTTRAPGPKLEILLGPAPPIPGYAVRVTLEPRPKTHPTYR